MTTQRVDGSRWPTATQELLLGAALLRGERAIESWRRWMEAEDLEGQLDGGSFRLLPLVYRNLTREGFEELPARLRGVYRQTWYRNRIVAHAVGEVLDRFEAAGIQTMLLKGAALAAVEYGELGVRPMADVDVAVPWEDARKAIRTLLAADWRSPTHPDSRFAATLRVFHAAAFVDGAGGSLDLHWHIMEESCRPGADAPFWAAARAIEFEGRKTKALSPADSLVNVSVHGARWDPVPPIRWVADAATIIQAHAEGLDWHAVVERSRQLEATLSMRDALEYLRKRFDAPVPDSVIADLTGIAASRLERWDHRAQAAPPTAIHQVERYATRYLRMSRGRSPWRRTVDFPVFLREMWGSEATWSLPVEGVRRVFGRAEVSSG